MANRPIDELVIDGIGAFDWLSTLQVYTTRRPVQGLTVTLATSDADAAVQMTSAIEAALSQRAVLESRGRAHLQAAYDASDEDIAALAFSGIELDGHEITAYFDLPAGGPMEYLTVVFDAQCHLLRSSGGNY